MTAANAAFRNLVKNSSMMFLLNVAGAGVSVITIPIMLKIMGVESYGQLVLVQAIALAAFTVCTFQYWQGMLIAFPGHRIGHLQLRRAVLRSFAFESLGIAVALVLVVILSMIGLKQFGQFTTVQVLLLSLAAVFPMLGTHTAYFRLVNRYNVLMLAGFLANVIKLILLILVARYSPSISVMVTAFVLPELVRFVLLFYMIFSWQDGVDGHLDANAVNQRKIMDAGRWSTLQAISDLPVVQLDRVIIGFTLPGHNLGVFAILKRIYALINMATAPFYSTSIPEFAARVNAGDIPGAFSLWRRTMKLLFGVTALAAIGCFALKGLWMPHLFPVLESYQREFLVVLLSAVVAGGFITTHSLYWALGNLKRATVITVSTNVLYLGLLWLMTWSLGLIGALGAFLVHVIIVAAVKITLLNRKYTLLP
jgi:O-antigen/teichoic acid export membrane protein